MNTLNLYNLHWCSIRYTCGRRLFWSIMLLSHTDFFISCNCSEIEKVIYYFSVFYRHENTSRVVPIYSWQKALWLLQHQNRLGIPILRWAWNSSRRTEISSLCWADCMASHFHWAPTSPKLHLPTNLQEFPNSGTLNRQKKWDIKLFPIGRIGRSPVWNSANLQKSCPKWRRQL